MKSIWAGAAALALLLPAAAQGTDEKPLKIGELSRCAGVYQALSEIAEKNSDASLLSSRRFLQYYLIMVAVAESDATDMVTSETVKTLFEAESAAAEAKIVLAKAGGGNAKLFTADFAACDAIRTRDADLFAAADKQIDALVAKPD
jgi:hypothetical protein